MERTTSRILDLWLFAENEDGKRQYLVRTARPRFIAEIEDDPENPDTSVIEQVHWLDEPPADAAAIARLMRLAGEALARYDERLFEEADDEEVH